MRGWALPAAALTVAVMTGGAAAAPAEPIAHSGRFDRPYHGFAPPTTVLHAGTPADVGLDPAPIADALDTIAGWTEPSGAQHPMYAGSVALLASNGVVVANRAAGYELRYADADGTELPPQQRVPARTDTIFDLASLSKLFTSVVALQQIEAGRIALDAPVARYLPEFGVNGKSAITVKELLTHTSGLQPDPSPSLWQGYPDIPSRIKAVLDVAPVNPPGSAYVYSDLNMITLGLLVARVAGEPLDVLVRKGITDPLSMVDTSYNPQAGKLDRIAATEYESSPPRGMVRGSVHDENAWALGGVAGHAGVFSTAADLAVLGQAILNGGSYRGRRILRPDTVRAMLTDYNAQLPNGPSPGGAHGLGFELDQRWYMDGLSGQRTAGHTGFTGTSIVLDPDSRSVAILLTNRVHPSRSWGSNNPARRALARGMAQSLAVLPRHGDEWFSGVGDNLDETLSTANLTIPADGASATFDAFVDTESTDGASLESSVDGGGSWQPIPLHANGSDAPVDAVSRLSGAGHRAWWQVTSAALPTGQVRLRWRYTSDQLYSGRGVYLDGIRVAGRGGVVLDAERDPSALTAVGWRLANR